LGSHVIQYTSCHPGSNSANSHCFLPDALVLWRRRKDLGRFGGIPFLTRLLLSERKRVLMPLDRSAFNSEYTANLETYRRLQDEAVFSLEAALKNAGIKVHQVLSRIKTADSLYEKAVRKETVDPFKDITDLVGLRAICLYLSDVPAVCKVIKDAFSVEEENDKINPADPTAFGYMSIHYVASIRRDHVGPRYQGLQGRGFEVQVRTICMDAWANISHHIDYKTDRDIPDELKRDFYALSGLFYVADKHFELFYAARESIWQREINFSSLTEYLGRRFRVDEEVDIGGVFSLVSELAESGYKTISQLDESLARSGSEALMAEERRIMRDRQLVGVVRAAPAMADPRFALVSQRPLTGRQMTN
jgi:ppGpp synthetase/RelA/SpoT-type nucleotidyltranferase